MENYVKMFDPGTTLHQNIKHGLHLTAAYVFFSFFVVVVVVTEDPGQVEISRHTTPEGFINAGSIPTGSPTVHTNPH